MQASNRYEKKKNQKPKVGLGTSRMHKMHNWGTICERKGLNIKTSVQLTTPVKTGQFMKTGALTMLFNPYRCIFVLIV